jgi:hypothetical protein
VTSRIEDRVDDDAFAAYVINNAPRYEIETLERILKAMRDNIASRRWGKPAGLEIGSKVAATMFDVPFTEYGEVVSMTPKACTIESPSSSYKSRISFKRYAVRLLSEFEWNHVARVLEERSEQFEADRKAELEARVSDRASAISERLDAERITMAALNGAVELFRGAYVHAHQPDQGSHEYGIIMHLTPKSIILSNSESDWESRVWVAKTEVTVLDERQWAVVDAEQSRRREEYENAKKAGRTNKLPDYYFIPIKLD